jgi:hypothetical protein
MRPRMEFSGTLRVSAAAMLKLRIGMVILSW